MLGGLGALLGNAQFWSTVASGAQVAGQFATLLQGANKG